MLNQVVQEKDQAVVLEGAGAAVPVDPVVAKAAVREDHPAVPADLEAVQIAVEGVAAQMVPAVVQAAVREDHPAAPADLEAVQIAVAGIEVPVAPAVVTAAVRAIQPEALLVDVVNPVDQAVARVLVVPLTGIGQVEPLVLCQVGQLERVTDQVPAHLELVAGSDMVLYPIWCYEPKTL